MHPRIAVTGSVAILLMSMALALLVCLPDLAWADEMC
jgi:hypothetical protein